MYQSYEVKEIKNGYECSFWCPKITKGYYWYRAKLTNDGLTIYRMLPDVVPTEYEICFKSMDYAVSPKYLHIAIDHYVNKQMDIEPSKRVAFIWNEQRQLCGVRGCRNEKQ